MAKDGGQAFPRLATLTTHDLQAPHTLRLSAENVAGMSLRDYFAGQALAAFDPSSWHRMNADELAGICYDFADAMLKAREK